MKSWIDGIWLSDAGQKSASGKSPLRTVWFHGYREVMAFFWPATSKGKKGHRAEDLRLTPADPVTG
jgi:hypothetical protein